MPSVADDRHQDMGHHSESQADHDHAADFGKDLTWPWPGAAIVHEHRAFRFVLGGGSDRAMVKVVHGVLERGDAANMAMVAV